MVMMARIAKKSGFCCAHACRTCGARCILEPHAINIMHKCENDHAEPFDPTVLADAFNSGLMEAERSIREMLRQEYPDMHESEVFRLAHEGALKSAEVRQGELESGTETDIFCVCSHPQNGHVGAAGRCKEPSCDCEMFVPYRVKMGTSQ
jgi:hypothetical protein